MATVVFSCVLQAKKMPPPTQFERRPVLTFRCAPHRVCRAPQTFVGAARAAPPCCQLGDVLGVRLELILRQQSLESEHLCTVYKTPGSSTRWKYPPPTRTVYTSLTASS